MVDTILKRNPVKSGRGFGYRLRKDMSKKLHKMGVGMEVVVKSVL